jgi:hypothetical protein
MEEAVSAFILDSACVNPQPNVKRLVDVDVQNDVLHLPPPDLRRM